MVSGSNRGVVRVWELDSGKLLLDLKQYGEIMGLALSPEGSLGVSGSENGVSGSGTRPPARFCARSKKRDQ